MKIVTPSGKELEIEKQEDNYFIGGQEVKNTNFTLLDDGFVYLHLENQVIKGWIEKYDNEEKNVTISIGGKKLTYQIIDRYDALLKELGMEDLAGAGQEVLKAPMPGKVVEVMVKEGEDVEEGSPLLILEAMKMENVLKATGNAKVKKVAVEKGGTVEKNKVLIEFE